MLRDVQDGVPVSSHLFSSLFAACAAAGTQEMLEAADKSHLDMEGLWNMICSKGKTAAEEQLQLANDHKCCDAGQLHVCLILVLQDVHRCKQQACSCVMKKVDKKPAPPACMYVCICVCLLSWGPTEGQSDKVLCTCKC